MAASLAGVIADRKDRQYSIADELEDLATATGNGAGHGIEISVENLDHLGGGCAIRQRGEITHIGKPDCGINELTLSTLKGAGKDPAGGVAPKVDIEQRVSCVVGRLELQRRTEAREEGVTEGLAKGMAKGKAEGILTMMRARGLALSERVRTRVLGCSDLGMLDRWLVRAATAASDSEVITA